VAAGSKTSPGGARDAKIAANRQWRGEIISGENQRQHRKRENMKYQWREGREMKSAKK